MSKKIPLSTVRYTITDTDSELQIVMPPVRRWFLILYLFPMSLFLLGVALSSIIAPTLVIAAGPENGPPHPAIGIMCVMAFPVIFGVGMGTYFFHEGLNQLFGQEKITIASNKFLLHSPRFGFWASTEEYEAQEVRNIRVASPSISPFNITPSQFRYMSQQPTIAFDYGAKTFRFGGGLEEAEAKYIVAEIVNRFPQYGKLA